MQRIRVFLEMALELRLHSPAGAEPVVYQWPLTSGTGSVGSWLIVLSEGSLTNAKMDSEVIIRIKLSVGSFSICVSGIVCSYNHTETISDVKALINRCKVLSLTESEAPR